MFSDPISDLLTRIRNAGVAEHPSALIPNSNVKREIVRVLEEEGYISGSEVVPNPTGPGECIRVKLKYLDGQHVITGLERASRPGQRRYVATDDLPTVLGGLGVAILTTSKGVMTSKAAAENGVGGEYLCSVW